MFQLIVAVISIALIAALAIASIFYGGDAFLKSSNKAQVTALVNQAQQISGAYALYRTDNGGVSAATDVAGLVSGGYLQAAPTPPTSADTGAVWTMGTGQASIALKSAAMADVCAEVLKQNGGVAASTDASVSAGAQFSCTTTGFAFKL